MKYKKCTKCKRTLPLSEFQKDRTRGVDGYKYRCRECRHEQKVEYLKTEKGKRLSNEYARNYIKKYPEKYKEYLKQWRNNNPEKVKAHGIFTRAIKNGILKREPCVVCGNEKSEGHHYDYSKPLNVIWLCKRHHVAVHKNRLNIINYFKQQ